MLKFILFNCISSALVAFQLKCHGMWWPSVTRGNKSTVVVQEQFYSCGLIAGSLMVAHKKQTVVVVCFDKEIYFSIM